ncbi:hypothetical protein KO528_09515 [Saccharophagus degradans]|uniref:hypothetical protein n=1 Tax=Saccharophagus degradans TaxID=86304 RepID=UPI001C091FB7|nr:hypothetical protein [Saccharophagus degradans]MBU2985588.1 hypothetical protein [Saccharophagus degradans]
MRTSMVVSVLLLVIAALAWRLYCQTIESQELAVKVDAANAYSRQLELDILRLEEALQNAQANTLENKLKRTNEQFLNGFDSLVDELKEKLSDELNDKTTEPNPNDPF